MGKFFGYPEGGVGADEVHGPDFHRVRTDEDKFQNVLRTGDAADADDRDLDRIADLPDAAQGHGLHGGAGEPPHHIGEQRLAGLHIDAHAGDGVDAGDSIGSGLLGGLGDGGDVRHVGRQLHDDGQVPRVFLDRLGHFGGEGRILSEQHAPVLHVGAGDVHFQTGDAFLGGEDARQFREFSRRGGVEVGDDRRFMPRQAGQFVLEEGFHAVILQTHGIEHTAGGFRHAGQRIAGTRLEGKPFHHDAAEMREIAVIGELDAVSERARGRQDGVLEDERFRVSGRLMGGRKSYGEAIHG